MINLIKKIFRKRNKCITLIGCNREFVRIKRVKDLLSLKEKNCLSKYFIGAKSIAPIEKDYCDLTII